MVHFNKRRSALLLLLVSFAWLIKMERHTTATIGDHGTSPVTLVASCADDATLVSAPMERESKPRSTTFALEDFWGAPSCCIFEKPNIALLIRNLLHDKPLLGSHLLYTQTTSSHL